MIKICIRICCKSYIQSTTDVKNLFSYFYLLRLNLFIDVTIKMAYKIKKNFFFSDFKENWFLFTNGLY
jgi:membrane protein CcdC involved in cytochrome C biogenesis